MLSVILPSALLPQDFPVEEPGGILSPELTEGKVVFRLWADYASEVLLDGSWLGSARHMQKMPGGVREYHTFGLKPDMYSYAFIVDGVRIADPNNVQSSQDGSNVESFFFLDGPATEKVQAYSLPRSLII